MAPVHMIRLVWLALLLIVTACATSDDDETVTGKGSIRALNAVSDLNSVFFLIEEVSLGSLRFKEVTGLVEYDDLEYTFRFEILLPGDTTATTIASTTLEVDSEFEYTFVLAGTFAAPELIVWEQFGRDWVAELEDADENDTEVTVMEVSFGNLSLVAGPVDVYLETPGTSPLFTAPKATIGYADLQTAIELAEGEYQLILTPVGDATTILLATDPIQVNAATSNSFVIMDDGGMTAADYSVRWIGTNLGVELFDIDVKSEISVVHAGLGTGAVDVVTDGDFANPFVAGLPFEGYSPFADFDQGAGTLNVNVIPAGNPGVFLAERTFNIDRATINRMYLVGLPGDLQAVMLREDRRSISTHGKMQFFQGAVRFQTVDLYFVGTDIDISLIGPTYSSFLFGTGSGLNTFEPGDYNFVVTETGTKNIVGGPYEFTVVAGENVGAVILDSPNITATNLLLIDLNRP